MTFPAFMEAINTTRVLMLSNHFSVSKVKQGIWLMLLYTGARTVLLEQAGEM